MDQSFPPNHRFHHGRDYGRVLRRRQRAGGKWVSLSVGPRPKRGPKRARIGIMVSTKVNKHAVRRHQLKRWVREWFRTQAKEQLHGWDCAVVFRSDPPADGHAKLDAELNRLVAKALATEPKPREGGQRK